MTHAGHGHRQIGRDTGYSRAGRVLAMGVAVLALALSAACGASAPIQTSSPTPTQTPTPRPNGTPPAPSVPSHVMAFLGELQNAVRQGDTQSLMGRAHSAAVELYGSEMCEGYFRDEFTADTTYSLEPSVSHGPMPMELTIDGRTLRVDDAYEVEVRVVEGGKSTRTTMYLAQEEGELMWFPDCGRPLLSDEQAERFLLARVEGTGVSEPFEAPDSWRIEARAGDGACSVTLHDTVSGATETLRTSDESFLIQRGGRGTFRVESAGCAVVSVYENTAET